MIRVVLENSVSVWKVSCFAADHGLIFYDKIAGSEGVPEEVIWASRDATTRMHRIDDPYSKLIYLQIEGESEAQLATAAVEELDGLTAEILLAAMKGRSEDAVSPPSVAALGVLAPARVDPDFMAAFRWLFEHPAPHVRQAAIAATAYVAWPELVTDVERISRDDPDESIRTYAANASEMLRKHLSAGREG